MKICSIILARGGSKAIPKKNIIPIKGKPLIQYSIEASQGANVDETWVSTDCPEIKAVALKLGSQVIDRPESISGDNSKSDEALVHFAQNVNFDRLVFIQPTSPLLESKYINEALRKMDWGTQRYDSMFSVCGEHWVPRWNLNGTPHGWDLNNRPMRQDMPETYVENGAFYVTNRKPLLDSGLRYSGKIGMIVMPLDKSFQIDTMEDLTLIEKLL